MRGRVHGPGHGARAAVARWIRPTPVRRFRGWLVINKTDLAPAVGADLNVMARDAKKMRGPGPVVFAQVKHGGGVDDIIAHVLHAWQHASGVVHHH